MSAGMATNALRLAGRHNARYRYPLETVIARRPSRTPSSASHPVRAFDGHGDVFGIQARTAATYSPGRSTGKRWPAPSIG